jgi:hypothetical protein
VCPVIWFLREFKSLIAIGVPFAIPHPVIPGPNRNPPVVPEGFLFELAAIQMPTCSRVRKPVKSVPDMNYFNGMTR